MFLCPSVSLPSAAETPDIRRWTGTAPNDCPVKICRKFIDSNDSTYKVFSNRRERGERQMHVIGKGKDREGRGRGEENTGEMPFYVLGKKERFLSFLCGPPRNLCDSAVRTKVSSVPCMRQSLAVGVQQW